LPSLYSGSETDRLEPQQQLAYLLHLRWARLSAEPTVNERNVVVGKEKIKSGLMVMYTSTKAFGLKFGQGIRDECIYNSNGVEVLTINAGCVATSLMQTSETNVIVVSPAKLVKKSLTLLGSFQGVIIPFTAHVIFTELVHIFHPLKWMGLKKTKREYDERASKKE